LRCGYYLAVSQYLNPILLLSDHLGSSSVRTNANGGLDASALYKAFGETRFTSGSLGTDYKFTGQREEVSLGIYWFQSRWFDATLGRFTQPDSIVPTQTQGTQAWDRYAFVNNNPIKYVDLTGHDAISSDLWREIATDVKDIANDYTSNSFTAGAVGGVLGAVGGGGWLSIVTTPIGAC
jgi:RHS repeat-associated protein